MINNFNQIGKILDIQSFIVKDIIKDEECFFLQIIKRRKDNPEMKRDAWFLHYMYIRNSDHLFFLQDEIIQFCNDNNARAYINLNPVSKKKVALGTLELISKNLASDNYNIDNCYISTMGKTKSPKEARLWLIDNDSQKEASPLMIAFLEHTCRPVSKDYYNQKIISIIPTKNGHHIITKPFDVLQFRTKYPDIDIHKNNPTLLYTT